MGDWLTYETAHWGDKPSEVLDVDVPGRAEPVGVLLSISYATRKGDQRGVWEHQFVRPPTMHRADDAQQAIGPDAEVFELGQVIDMVIGTNGNRTRILGGTTSIVCTGDGRHFFLATVNAKDRPRLTLQVGKLQAGRVHVTEHGIVT